MPLECPRRAAPTAGKKVLWRTRCPGSTARRIPCLPRATLGAPRRAGRRTMPEPKTLMGKCVAAVEALAEPEGASRVSIKKVRACKAAREALTLLSVEVGATDWALEEPAP